MRYREDFESRFTGRHKACVEFSGDELQNNVVLDIGCSIGWYEKFMVEQGCFMVGMDLMRSALHKAKKSVSAGSCEFVCASALMPPFKTSCFDVICFFDVLEHLPAGSESIVFSKTNSMLRSNGLLIMSVPNNHFVSKLLDPAYFLIDHRHYDIPRIRTFMEKTDFEICEVRYGGGIVEALSMVLLYLFKHLFGMEVPFKSFLEYLRNKEYQGKGFATLFIKAMRSQ